MFSFIHSFNDLGNLKIVMQAYNNPSLSTFRRHLKTHLFRCCYNTLWFCCTYSDYSGPHGGVAA